jgi:hypothetical protein
MTILNDFQLVQPDLHIIARGMTVTSGKLSTVKTVDLAQALVSVQLQGFMAGASTLTLTLDDPDWVLMDSGVFDADKDSKLDQVTINYPDGSRFWWQLLQINAKADHTITLVMIDQLAVSLMNLYDTKGVTKTDRAKATRAEFIKALFRSVPGIEFYCNHLAQRQQIAGGAVSSSSTTSSSAVPAGTPAPKSSGNDWWEVRCSAEDASSGTGWTELSPNGNAAAKLGIAHSFANSHRFPDFSSLGKDYTAGAHSGSGFKLRLANPANGKTVEAPMTDYGDGSSFAPAIGICPALAAQLGWSGGNLHIQGVSEALNPYPGMGTRVSGPSGALVSSAAGGGSTTTTTTTVEAYNFEVQPHESFWDAANRLAQEVNWELILDGNRVYYDSDQTLINQAIAATIHRDDPAVVDWAFDWDARQICTLATLTLICDAFDAASGRVHEFMAGEALQLEGFGTATAGSTASPHKFPGRWLIQDFTRNLGDITSTLTLRQPTMPILEPAPQVSTSTSSAGGTGSAGGAAGGATSPAALASASNTVAGHPELKPGISRMYNLLKSHFPQAGISSTVRSGENPNGCTHTAGRAADIIGPSQAYMDNMAAWLAANMTSGICQGIHQDGNGQIGLSVNAGASVGIGFWGPSTWSQHINHIHLAV